MCPDELFIRSRPLFGDDGVERIRSAHVALFGIGGVGSFTAEALARAGIGRLTLIDGDEVAPSNLNRQLIATSKNIGMAKVTAAKERILEINPDAEVNAVQMFYTPENAGTLDLSDVDYIADAIDTVTSKIYLIKYAFENKIPVISCMGAGNKLDPTRFRVSTLDKTSVCPLAKVMRRELKSRGVAIDKIKAVWSDEEPAEHKTEVSDAGSNNRRSTPASVSFVPSAAGLVMAGEIICDIAFAR